MAKPPPEPQEPSNESASAPAQLSFSPKHYAKLAPSSFLYASLTSSSASGSAPGSAQSLRPNGRTPSKSRAASINAGSLTNANGSAVVRLGDTAVVCGVRAELLPASGEHMHSGLPAELQAWEANGGRRPPLPPTGEGEGGGGGGGAAAAAASKTRRDADVLADLSLLVPNLELSTGCNPSHLPGQAPGALAQSLTQRILSLLRISDLVALEPLLVWYRPEKLDGADDGIGNGGGNEAPAQVQLKAIWTLYIDIVYISLDGGAFTGAWLAVLAALRDTVLPKAWWDEDREMVVCSPLREDAVPLELGYLPVPLTALVFTHRPDGTKDGERLPKWILHDADDFEESVCEGEITVVVNGRVKGGKASMKSGSQVLRVEATGKGVGSAEVTDVLQAAHERWSEWHKVLRWEGGA